MDSYMDRAFDLVIYFFSSASVHVILGHWNWFENGLCYLGQRNS